MHLQGKVAIVAGAGKAVGKGIALRYALEGADVVLASRFRDLKLAAADEVNGYGFSEVIATRGNIGPGE